MTGQAKTFEENAQDVLRQITVSTLEMAPENLDKQKIAILIESVEVLKSKVKAHKITSMLRLVEWWDKLLTASLLDQITNEKEAYCLLCFFADRARLALRGVTEDQIKAFLDSRDLIERAAVLLTEPVPDFGENETAPEEMEPQSGDDKGDADDFFVAVSGDGNAADSGDCVEMDRDIEPALESEDPCESAAPENSLEEGVPAGGAGPLPCGEDQPERIDFTGTLYDESLIYEFIEECEGHLENIESKILSLEDNPDDRSLVDEVFRPVHSIKGGAGFLGVKAMQDFAHKAENLLDETRKGKLPITSDLVETLLEVVDVLKTMLSQLRTMANRELGKDSSRSELPPVPVRKVVSHIGAVLNGHVIEDPSAAAGKDKIGEILLNEGVVTEEQIDRALSIQERPLGRILVEEGIVSQEKVEEALKVQGGGGRPPRGVIKVDIEKLDELMNHVGELVIAQTLVRGSSISRNGDGDQTFGKDIAQLGKITKEIQDRVMSLRMVPLKPVFQKMTRVVRDVSRKSGKQVQLVLSGEDTEVDKTVSETISDPLVHILRNSVDHGIESPADRTARGKDEVGKIHLSAYHQGGNIVIEITDDGKGLDRDRILQKAIERGLAEAGAKLSDQQVFQFIMMPGFSTAEKVTDISGRGVGMDVVRKNIEQLRGKVEVVSTQGSGTTVTIKLPLTLAIIDGMVVRVGSENFIFPTLSIVRSFRPDRSQISTVKGKGEMVNVRGQLMPLVRLHHLYGIQPSSCDPTSGLCVILENEGGNYALLVDELLGQQQVVIKNLGAIFKEVKGIAGGTIMGDGRVGLILDMAGIYEAYHDANYVEVDFGLHDGEIAGIRN